MLRRSIVALAAAAACMFAILATASAEAAPPIRISAVQYDSPGTDDGSNKSLNAEWFRITNFGSKVRTLAGWKVRDSAGHVYTFPTGYKLAPGKSVRIHTGKGSNTAAHLYWKKSWYVWNNTGDKATLKNKAGTVIDTCTWGDGSGFTSC